MKVDKTRSTSCDVGKDPLFRGLVFSVGGPGYLINRVMACEKPDCIRHDNMDNMN